MMIFIDGENLVCRYQDMLEQGYKARDDVAHLQDVFVWFRGFSHLVRYHEVQRATYYTSAVGSAETLVRIREQIQATSFHQQIEARDLVSGLHAKVFKKAKKSARSRLVDIQMTIDVLNHVGRDNVDTVYLMTGDGDFAPLIDEVHRCGKQLYHSAFSSGLSQELALMADKTYCLDNTTFTNLEEMRSRS